ncbi:DNA cytosine methyltransferase [uncultured Sphingomonas sp.]|uniref:DNA cytosine methyltransferase n=1 Tax=uncultured Sphingomonas sp. TaxID=158754 RepID=UPI0026208E89|nr:DNA cytosine methyltransferase [uncultured Sphingomonas sp.]
MRAIDLYAGVGGWSLGLRLAGIEVVASYEWWQPAIDTHNGNLGGDLVPVDIRKLDIAGLPEDIDLVIGSPPCTQFSYSNRGGNGDIADGLKDLVRFFEVVEHLQPTYWVMENVPRVADVLRRGFIDPKHPLYRFRHLDPEVHVYDMATFGTPQARKRCIAGILPFKLLEAYRSRLPRLTLGEVVDGLCADHVTDPVWGVVLDRAVVTEMEREPRLTEEEGRMNREAKVYHPVYNNMSFPDDPSQPSRTVTATCTRVSRESIVIEDPAAPGDFRRLTVRERASLQGFPITYQFFGKSFAEKRKMVGNAIPPSFTYLVGNAANGTAVEDLVLPHDAGRDLRLPEERPKVTRPDAEGATYLPSRRFRAALPGLRFKSGMRFELANHGEGGCQWHMRFLFGPSRDVREIDLDALLLSELSASTFIQGLRATLRRDFLEVEALLASTSPARLQAAWTRRGDGIRPYALCDALGALAGEVCTLLGRAPSDVKHAAVGYVLEAAAQGDPGEIVGAKKLTLNALAVLSGLLVGSWFNTLDWHGAQRLAA